MELPLPGLPLAWAGDPRVRPRTQAGIAVSAGDGRWTLINASPDLRRANSRDARAASARRLRGSPIDAVVLTGAEIDQIAGLLSLRESTPSRSTRRRRATRRVAANADVRRAGAR